MNAGAPTVTAELVLLRWMLASPRSLSNTELASISNLNRSWREATKQAILEEASGPMRIAPLLLLPSMVRNILQYRPASPSFENSKALQGAMTSCCPSEDETFCAAWFAPEGVREIEICLRDESTVRDPSVSVNCTPQPQPTQHQHASFSFMLAQVENAGQQVGVDKVQEEEFVSVCVEWKGYSTAMQVLQPFSYDAPFVHDVISSAFALAHNRNCCESSWTAVRGATSTRPESYCLCVEAQRVNLELDLTRGITPADQCALLQNRRRIDRLQRDVCPRVIRRKELGTKAVQFLNATQSHAVCMMTPRFEPPIRSPMTILCVGVATEDGCFLSGLFNRLELGHLYPQTAVHSATELSSICLATDSLYPAMVKTEEDSEASSDGFGIDSDASESLVQNCTCQYRGVCDKAAIPEETDDSSREPPFVCRGSTGPGSWHCYVAILDGNNTVIRVDGIQESSIVSSSLEGLSVEPNTILDGLTLGSDHCFGMSLCCGGMSDGSGHGAIAEVAVFSGRLPNHDITMLEQYLMQKHAIPAPCELDRDQWEREAHALLMVEDETGLGFGGNVPLRYLARHRSVAWSQCDPVTGESLEVKRIGSRLHAESSDF